MEGFESDSACKTLPAAAQAQQLAVHACAPAGLESSKRRRPPFPPNPCAPRYFGRPPPDKCWGRSQRLYYTEINADHELRSSSEKTNARCLEVEKKARRRVRVALCAVRPAAYLPAPRPRRPTRIARGSAPLNEEHKNTGPPQPILAIHFTCPQIRSALLKRRWSKDSTLFRDFI